MSVIDEQKFSDNIEMLGEDVMLQVIDLFLEGYPERKQELETAFRTNDLEKMEFAAHSLKNDLAHFGAQKVLKDSQDFLEHIRSKETTSLQQKFGELIKVIEQQLIPELKEWYNRKQT